MKPRHVIPEQEPLIVTASTGQIHERNFNFETGEYYVDPISRNLHLINTLDAMAHIAQLEGLLMSAQYPGGRLKLQHEYRTGAAKLLRNARSKIDELRLLSEWEFARADGMFARIDSGAQSARTARAETRRAYEAYAAQFGDIQNGPERDAERTRLQKEIDALQEQETRTNRREGLRPHRKARNEDERLSSQERLRAIADDPRAGFMPTTHREKTTVMSMLDYLDNPAYRLGTRSQLLEISVFHRKKGNRPGADWQKGREYGEQAARSIAYELGDYLMDASRQLEYFKDLQVILSGTPNPSISLRDAVADVRGDDHPAFAGLTRYRDLVRLRDDNDVAEGLPHHPLYPYRNETTPELAEYDPPKNKVIEDPYMRSDIEAEFADRIAALPDELSVREARSLVSEAINDAERRAFFMYERLKEFSEPSQERSLKQAHQAAVVALKKYVSMREVTLAA